MAQKIITWLEAHMGTGSFQEHAGVVCPGCGIQRSIIALLKGEILESILLYVPVFSGNRYKSDVNCATPYKLVNLCCTQVFNTNIYIRVPGHKLFDIGLKIVHPYTEDCGDIYPVSGGFL